jgi:hypothetical protein
MSPAAATLLARFLHHISEPSADEGPPFAGTDWVGSI